MKKSLVLWVILTIFAFALMSGGCGNDDSGDSRYGYGAGTADTHPYLLNTPLTAFSSQGKRHAINIDLKTPPPDSVACHIQEYGKYRDYHILTHSNFGSTDTYPGYIYFHQEKDGKALHSFRIKSPGGRRLAHPGGFQVIGDFMVCASGLGEDAHGADSIAWILDLSPLKNNEIPGTFKTLMTWPEGTSVAAVGITDLAKVFIYDEDDYWVYPEISKHLLAVHRYGERLDLYITDYSYDPYPTSLRNTNFRLYGSVDMRGKEYDGLNLFRDTNGDVWMYAFMGVYDAWNKPYITLIPLIICNDKNKILYDML